MSDKIFISPEEIKASADIIRKCNEDISSCLSDFSAEIDTVDWEALGRESMKDSFNNLRPSFEKMHNYISKVVNFLNQNVAEDALALDSAIKGNGSELKSRF